MPDCTSFPVKAPPFPEVRLSAAPLFPGYEYSLWLRSGGQPYALFYAPDGRRLNPLPGGTAIPWPPYSECSLVLRKRFRGAADRALVELQKLLNAQRSSVSYLQPHLQPLIPTKNMPNKLYFDHEIKALERARYWSAFLSGALVAATLCLLLVFAYAFCYATKQTHPFIQAQEESQGRRVAF